MTKKDTILFITIFCVLALIAGSTYAYWGWSSNESKSVVFNTSKGIEDYVIYDEGDSHFVGDFSPTSSFCDGMSNTISFSKKDILFSQKLVATINMNVNSIGDNIKNSDAVYWVITAGDSSVCPSLDDAVGYGKFSNISAGSTIKLKNNIEITLTEQKFTIWIWIDSNESNLSNLSGETIDVNIWTQIDMFDGTKGGGYNGSFTHWDALVNDRLITVSNGEIIYTASYLDYNFVGILWISDTITSIGEYAFYQSGLSCVVIPSTVTLIGENVFQFAETTSVVMPRSVISIGSGAFYLSQISDIYYEGTSDEWNAIEGIGDAGLENITIHYNYKW